MQKRPFFSIIIPVYNIESYLPECIESVLTQDFDSFEIIIINDNSTDNSLNVCSFYAEKDSRIKILNNINKGVSEARNLGLRYSKGTYIVFLDGDDYINKNGKVLSKIYDILKNETIDVLLFNLIPFFIGEDGNCIINRKTSAKEDIPTDDIKEIFNRKIYLASPCDKIVKRKLIEDFKLEFPVGLLCEDIKWSGDLLVSSKQIYFFPIRFYFYRKNRVGSTTYVVSKKNIEDSFIQVYNHYLLKDVGKNIYLDKFYAFYYLVCIKQMCETNYYEVDEIVTKMEPMIYYLKLNNDKRVIVFKAMNSLFGFRNAIRIIKNLLKGKL